MHPGDSPSDTATRIRAAADAYEEHTEARRIAKQRRDELIVLGYEEDAMSPGLIARHARLSRTMVNTILAEH